LCLDTGVGSRTLGSLSYDDLRKTVRCPPAHTAERTINRELQLHYRCKAIAAQP